MRYIIVFLVVLLVFQFVFAQELVDETSWDYSSAESYLDPGFYSDPNSDPSQWDLSNPSFNWDLAFARDDVFEEVNFWSGRFEYKPVNVYSCNEFYQYPEFYANSDQEKWDPERIDWTSAAFWDNLDLEKAPDYYELPEFYDNLPDEMYSEIDYTKVCCYTWIDQRKIDVSKYLADFGCKNCVLDKGESYIQFEENEFHIDWFYGMPEDMYRVVVLSGQGVDYPDGTLFTAAEDGIVVTLPSDYTEFRIDSSTLSQFMILDTQGRDLTIVDEAGVRSPLTVNGRVALSDYTFIARPGNPVVVNDIEVSPRREPVGLYADNYNYVSCSRVSSCNGVYIDKSRYYITGAGYEVEFQDNVYFPINPDENDRFTVEPLFDEVIVSKGPAGQGGPNLFVTGTPGQQKWAIIRNGDFPITVGANGYVDLDLMELLVNRRSNDPYNPSLYPTQSKYGNVPAYLHLMDSSTQPSTRVGTLAVSNSHTTLKGTISYVDQNGRSRIIGW